MKFKGRYWVAGGNVVVVHEGLWGHTINTKEPWNKPHIALRWNEFGSCVELSDGEEADLAKMREFDLCERVNPQGLEDQVVELGCKECIEERNAKLAKTKS